MTHDNLTNIGIKSGALTTSGSYLFSFLESHANAITAICAIVGAAVALLSFFLKVFLDIREDRRKERLIDFQEKRLGIESDSGERRRKSDTKNGGQ